MAISLRLDKKLECELTKLAAAEGKSKSDLVRSLISNLVQERAAELTAWDLGKQVFGRRGSGKGDRSERLQRAGRGCVGEVFFSG